MKKSSRMRNIVAAIAAASGALLIILLIICASRASSGNEPSASPTEDINITELSSPETRARKEVALGPPERTSGPSKEGEAQNELPLRIMGRVLDQSGRPLPEVLVVVPGRGVFQVEYMPDGEFRATELVRSKTVEEEMSVWVSSPGHESVARLVRSHEADWQDIGVLELREGRDIRIHIIDEAGNDLPGAQIGCFREGYGGYRSRNVPKMPMQYWPCSDALCPPGVADKRGEVLLKSVVVGDCSLWAFKQGYFSASADITESSRCVSGETALEMRLGSPTTCIHGLVFGADGSPCANAEVLVRTKGDAYIWSAKTEANGEFETALSNGESVHLQIQVRDGTWPAIEVNGVTASVDTQTFRFVDHAQMKVRVAGSEGKSVSKGSIHVLSDAQLPERARCVALSEAGETSVVIPQGTFLLEVTAPHYHTAKVGPISPKDCKGTLTINLSESADVSGKFVVEGTGPVSGIVRALSMLRSVGRSRQLTPEDRPFFVEREQAETSDTETNSDGSFSIALPSPGRYLLECRTRDGWFARSAPFVWKGQALQLDAIEMHQAGAVEGRLVLPTGEPVPHVRVAICDGEASSLTTTTSSLGEFRFLNLSPGGWQIRRCAPGLDGVESLQVDRTRASVPCTVDFTVASGVTTQFQFVIYSSSNCTLHGRFEYSKPGSFQWMVRIDPLDSPEGVDDSRSRSTMVRPDGTFALEVQSPGRYDLSLTDGKFITVASTIALEVGENDWVCAVDSRPVRVVSQDIGQRSMREYYLICQVDGGASVYVGPLDTTVRDYMMPGVPVGLVVLADSKHVALARPQSREWKEIAPLQDGPDGTSVITLPAR